MKVYVDELPKNCEECPMCRSGKLKLQRKGKYVEVEQCVFGQYKYQTIDDEIDTCPLQTITDHDKQVRKQVCSEIGGEIYTQMIVYGKELRYSDLNLILDKIEKGE